MTSQQKHSVFQQNLKKKCEVGFVVVVVNVSRSHLRVLKLFISSERNVSLLMLSHNPVRKKEKKKREKHLQILIEPSIASYLDFNCFRLVRNDNIAFVGRFLRLDAGLTSHGACCCLNFALVTLLLQAIIVLVLWYSFESV